jgi:class 3 adenylate cyclase
MEALIACCPKGAKAVEIAMEDEVQVSAWLESETAERIPVHGNCTFGRVPGNTVVLETPKMSRRHAMIHEQEGEFWIVDLGSTNGIRVQGERVTHPVRLQAGDEIQLPGASFTFRQVTEAAEPPESRLAPPISFHRATIADIQLKKCWILLADIQGFTKMSQQLPAEELAPLVGQWMARCQEILERQKGVLAKFLGDGFLGHWEDRAGTAALIAAACREFQALQKIAALPFRLIVHQGVISFGGHSPDASQTMMGPELNFAFRLEKVAARMELLWIFSEAAASQLGSHLPLVSCGPQKVPDFAPERVCFTLKS